MEDGLREKQYRLKGSPEKAVLILVLVEDGLRDKVTGEKIPGKYES